MDWLDLLAVQGTRKSLLQHHSSKAYAKKRAQLFTVLATREAGKDQKQKKRVAEGEMVRWHHQLSGHEFEQTLGDSEGQESLVCFSPWGHRESDTT